MADQLKVRDAFRSLDLLVQIDPWMSATAKEAHYVIAPTLQFEVPGISNTFDLISGAFPGVAMPDRGASTRPPSSPRRRAPT